MEQNDGGRDAIGGGERYPAAVAVVLPGRVAATDTAAYALAAAGSDELGLVALVLGETDGLGAMGRKVDGEAESRGDRSAAR
ncbi:alpha-1,3-glucan synthase [Aspergillus luchuensis]|uniref:Alpha-1,3-glucan synthase n=1 Tax=Aspergillus kawachii TaxID=1069201 RepID=A0A146F5R7_ASPKA|nr:alpha-1,3-glucan synthase [Aspergillus luchuensis]